MNSRNFYQINEEKFGKTRFTQEDVDEKEDDTESETSVSKPVPKKHNF